MSPAEHKTRRLVEWLRAGAELARATGRRYRIDLDALDLESLRELQRLLRDLHHEKQAAVNRARGVRRSPALVMTSLPNPVVLLKSSP
jgi:hypothetical protein